MLRDELLQTNTGLWDSIHEIVVQEPFTSMILLFVHAFDDVVHIFHDIILISKKGSRMVINILPPPEDVLIYENRYVLD